MTDTAPPPESEGPGIETEKSAEITTEQGAEITHSEETGVVWPPEAGDPTTGEAAHGETTPEDEEK
jgi:hypothetical protein